MSDVKYQEMTEAFQTEATAKEAHGKAVKASRDSRELDRLGIESFAAMSAWLHARDTEAGGTDKGAKKVLVDSGHLASEDNVKKWMKGARAASKKAWFTDAVRAAEVAEVPASERIADHLAAEHETRNQVFRALCPTDPKAAALSAIGRAVRAACKAGINPEAIGKAVARAIDAAQKDAAAKKANADKNAAAKKAA